MKDPGNQVDLFQYCKKCRLAEILTTIAQGNLLFACSFTELCYDPQKQGCPTTLLQPATYIVFLYSWTKFIIKFAGEETLTYTLWGLLVGKRSEFWYVAFMSVGNV